MTSEVISKSDLLFIETLYTPKALIEILFHDGDNLSSFDYKQFGELRFYQEPMLSDEAIVDWDLTARELKLNKKTTFQLKKNVGEIYCFGARKYGKSQVCMLFDILNDMMTSGSQKTALASVDMIHIRRILDPIKSCLQNHPICKLFERRIASSPDYQFELKTGYILNSVNFNIGSKAPGQQFYGHHFHKLYIEEASLENEEVYDKRKDAVSEFGAIFRISGMCNFTPQSPAGKAYYGAETHNHVLNYPQYVNVISWDEKEKRQRIEEYGGEHTINYRIYVKGDIVEDGISVFDMARVRQNCIVDKKLLTTIEITKDRFKHYKAFLNVERPVNAERIFVSADIGLNVTEINIFSEFKSKYEYIYNLTLNNLTDDEQSTVLKELASKIQANVIALDCGDGQGRAIYNELEKTIPKENLVWYAGTNKVIVGWETDKDGKVILANGKPIEKEEFMSEWSVKRLKDLFYQGLVVLPEDFKLITQFTQVIALTSGTRTIYKCIAKQGDHLFDSFRVFSIAQWLKANHNLTPPVKKQWCAGVTA